ncbi:MAG: hypothetical protein P8J59_02150 [Phycisphaerales bacterium]|jgi:hypothetical protein|nr:hypothetical protein [Phycisphaerales bacterium]
MKSRRSAPNHLMSTLVRWGALLGLSLSIGCSSQDPAGLRFTLQEDGKGSIAVAALTLPAMASVGQRDTTGVDWDLAAKLTFTTGVFDSLDVVAFEDLEVDSVEFTDPGGTIRISIPRGPDAKWYKTIHASAKDRGRLQKALDGAIDQIEIHENVTIAVEVEKARITASLIQTVPEVTVSEKRGLVSVVIPLEVLEAPGSPMILVINWEAMAAKK